MSFQDKSSKHHQKSGIWGILQKAAPRFELGIKDLQSSALPLGHAAIQGASTPQSDRISAGSGSLLLISNGHGEDLIALKIIEALRRQRPRLRLSVLPLVGAGGSFRAAIEKGGYIALAPPLPYPAADLATKACEVY